MKALMLTGALVSSLAPAAETVAHKQTRVHHNCPDNFEPETNLIDPNYSVIYCPRYVLSNLQIGHAKYFLNMNDKNGEVDRLATYYNHPEWYSTYPNIDPAKEAFNNPVNPDTNQHYKTTPTYFSDTIKNIYKNAGSPSGVWNKFYWDTGINTAQSALKINFTFKDTTTFEEQVISLYYNGGMVDNSYDKIMVAMIPGTKRTLNSNHISVETPNVAYVSDNPYSGTYGSPTTPSGASSIVVPTLFGYPMTFPNREHYIRTELEMNGVDKLTWINPYIFVAQGNHDGHWGAYYFNVLDGFIFPDHYLPITVNFIQARNLLYRFALNFAMSVYMKINNA